MLLPRVFESFNERLNVVQKKNKEFQLALQQLDCHEEIEGQLKKLKQEIDKLFEEYQLLIDVGYESNQDLLSVKEQVKQLTLKKETEDSDSHCPKHALMLIVHSMELERFLSRQQVVKPVTNKKPFLVELWTETLQLLEKISLFYIIRNFLLKEYTKGNYRFVDRWLIIHTILAVIYVIIAGIESVPLWAKYVFLGYSCLRMFEILIYQLNVILVHPYNTKNYTLNSYRRMTIALIHNFFEIIFWFAGTFITLQFISDVTVPMAIYTSFVHMVTYSAEIDETKWSIAAIFILQFQALIGVFMTVLSLARFISLFPQPASTDPYEQEANEQRHQHLVNQLLKIEQQVNRNTESITENRTNIEQFNGGDGKHEERHQDILSQFEKIEAIIKTKGNTEQSNVDINEPQEENTAIK